MTASWPPPQDPALPEQPPAEAHGPASTVPRAADAAAMYGRTAEYPVTIPAVAPPAPQTPYAVQPAVAPPVAVPPVGAAAPVWGTRPGASSWWQTPQRDARPVQRRHQPVHADHRPETRPPGAASGTWVPGQPAGPAPQTQAQAAGGGRSVEAPQRPAAGRPSRFATDGPAGSPLITARFLSDVADRIVLASVRQAQKTLDRLGDRSQEPGPHALMLFSADPQDDRPAEVRCSSRLFYAGEADDLLAMLDNMTRLIRVQTVAAQRGGRLWAALPNPERAHLERVTAGRLKQTRRTPFPLSEALGLGLLWDPRARGDQVGVATHSDTFTAATRYVGVGVITLDTETTPWAAIKDKNLKVNPRTGMPRTAANLQGTGFAYLDGGVALKVFRHDPEERWPQKSVVESNTQVGSILERRTLAIEVLRLIRDARPASVVGRTGAAGSVELWNGLHRLHQAVQAACGPGDDPR